MDAADVYKSARKMGMQVFSAPVSYISDSFGGWDVFDLKALITSTTALRGKRGIAIEISGKGGRTERVFIRMSKDQKLSLLKQLANEL